MKEYAKLYTLVIFMAQPLLIDAAGTLGFFQQVPGSPFIAGPNPAWSAFSPLASGNLFAAVPNYTGSNMSVYSVNQNTGVLTQVPGSPFSTGGNPAWVAFSPVLPSGNLFAGVPNANDNNVSVYLVNQATGNFTQVPGSPFAAGLQPYGIRFALASGNLFAAVPNIAGNNVSVYLVNQTTGAFTPVPGSPFATGSGPYGVSFSPVASGNLFAAVTNQNDNTVSVYLVNQTTGVFTPVAGSPFATGVSPIGIAFSPLASGNVFVAVTNSGDNNVSVYALNQTTGFFTPVPGSPFPADLDPDAVAFSPIVSGFLLAAVVNFNSNNVSVYEVNQTTGAFTQVSGSPFATGGQPDGISFSPLVSGGLFAIVANFADPSAVGLHGKPEALPFSTPLASVPGTVSVYSVFIPTTSSSAVVDCMWLKCALC